MVKTSKSKESTSNHTTSTKWRNQGSSNQTLVMLPTTEETEVNKRAMGRVRIETTSVNKEG